MPKVEVIGRAQEDRGSELRLRVIQANGGPRSVLTYKEPSVDAASGSKPEHETPDGDPAAADRILLGLGLRHLVAFEKHCTNYRFLARGRDMLATVVTVPEIPGMFIELETLVPAAELPAALTDIRVVLTGLGIPDGDLTNETYTDAVMRARAGPTGDETQM